MYEDKSKKSIEIDWKSLLIKLGILLVVVFLIIWIISLFNKKEENVSNFGVNLQAMRDAATEYFTGSRLPSEINDSKKITLKEMFDRNLLVEFQDEEGNSCDTANSYAEATKLTETNYRIEVKLVCDHDSDTIINTVKRNVTEQNDNEPIDEEEEEEKIDEESPSSDDLASNNSSGSGSVHSSNRPSSNTGSTSSSSKPNHSTNTNNNNTNHTTTCS